MTNASNAIAKAFIDTNVLVYAHDASEPPKCPQAIELIANLQNQDAIVVSVQVLHEFYSTMTRANRTSPLTSDEAQEIIGDIIARWNVVPLIPAITVSALRAIAPHAFSFWDALIWATAKEHGIFTIYTEDFQHGREVEGVRFVNPFVGT